MDVVDLEYAFGLARVDPAALGKALVQSSLSLARRPRRVLRRAGELVLAEWAVGLDAARMVRGGDGEPLVPPDPSDRRFADRAWRDNPVLRATLGSYLVSARTA